MSRARRDGRPRLYLVGEALSSPEPSAPPGVDLNVPIVDTRAAGDPAGLERDLALIDQVLAIQPVPQDVLVWRAVTTGSFELPWRELPGTLHQEPSYLAVALVRYPALGAAEAVLHLRVPAGIPGVYLNPFDHGDRLPAPTLLLGRGLAVFVHEVRRQDGQWYVRADLLPPPPPGWDRRPRVMPVARDGVAPKTGAGPCATTRATPGPAQPHVQPHPQGHLQDVVQEGSGHGR